jgi:hypothetical protein
MAPTTDRRSASSKGLTCLIATCAYRRIPEHCSPRRQSIETNNVFLGLQMESAAIGFVLADADIPGAADREIFLHKTRLPSGMKFIEPGV